VIFLPEGELIHDFAALLAGTRLKKGLDLAGEAARGHRLRPCRIDDAGVGRIGVIGHPLAVTFVDLEWFDHIGEHAQGCGLLLVGQPAQHHLIVFDMVKV